jgi:hypothetical protein
MMERVKLTKIFCKYLKKLKNYRMRLLPPKKSLREIIRITNHNYTL